jgi:biopolymer transport protein ExbD
MSWTSSAQPDAGSRVLVDMANIDTGSDDKSVDIKLNIVPFIDLMSCLTAFLLVTAVWTNLAQIPMQPKGVDRDGPQHGDNEPVRCSVLLQDDTIWVGLSRVDDFRRIPMADGAYDWGAFAEVLTELRDSRILDDDRYLEIAAEDAVAYQSIVTAMDKAIVVGFADVGMSDPASLSARPML